MGYIIKQIDFEAVDHGCYVAKVSMTIEEYGITVSYEDMFIEDVGCLHVDVSRLKLNGCRWMWEVDDDQSLDPWLEDYILEEFRRRVQKGEFTMPKR